MRATFRRLFLIFILIASFHRAELGAHAQSPDKDMQELQRYTLTMPGVTHFWETIGSLAKNAKNHPELKDALETDADKQEDLAAIEKRVGASPIVRVAILEHGLTAHEFVLIQITLLQSAVASATIPAGPDRVKKAHEANVNPANLEFVEKHKAELEALQEKNVPKDTDSQ